MELSPWEVASRSAIYLPMALQPLWTLDAFSVSYLYTVSRTLWTGDQPVARPLPTHGTTQTKNKRTPTSMPRVRIEPTIPVFERAKMVHALDRAATAIGKSLSYLRILEHSMEPTDALSCSQELSTGPYPEQDESTPHHPILLNPQ
jgi:hypothetical protein